MKKQEVYGVTCNDDRMNPIIRQGDKVITEKPTGTEVSILEINNNSLYVIVMGEVQTVARITVIQDGIILSFFNWQYTPIYFSNDDILDEKIHILGRVIESRQIRE